MRMEKINYFFAIIGAALSSEHSCGDLAKIKQQYIKSKEKFFPYFDENGLKEIEVDDSEGIDSNELEDLLRNIKYDDWRYYHALNEVKQKLAKFSVQEITQNVIQQDIAGTNGRTMKGMKLSKGLLLLPNEEEYTDDVLEYVNEKQQDAFSRIIQGIKTLKHRVRLSINPLDFLLVSDHGLRSCHNWRDGEHKTGWLSYMLDEVSAVAYSFRREDCFYNEPWAYKEWRQMVYFDLVNKSAIHSRHYPHTSTINAKFARRLTAEVLPQYFDCEYKWKVSYSSGEAKGSKEEQGTGKWQIYSTPFLYRDDATSAIVMKTEDAYSPSVVIGAQTIYCIECGRERDEYDRDNNILNCQCCNNQFRCCSCDYTYPLRERHQYDGGDYCEICFDSRFVTCEDCEEIMDRDDAHIHCADWLCDGCYDNRLEEEEDCDEDCEESEESEVGV